MLTTVAVSTFTVLLCAYHWRRAHRREKQDRIILETERSAGLVEPASLHPVIDALKCIGCGSCVAACPEESVLGLVSGKAELIRPTHCIGHGACKAACPTDALTLVFGTEKRGVDIPFVRPNFETNVPGVFIAGELGGMGLIRNAVEQGRQAMESIARLDGVGEPSQLDVVVVGAGPAGLSASLKAMEAKLRAVTLEQDSLGGTVAHYPRGKIVMNAAIRLPLFGKVRLRDTSKESLLKLWRDVEKRSGLEIHYQERMEEVARNGRGFVVKTTRGTYRTRTVLLAIGRRGTPRKLGVPGENLPKVAYRLIEPEQYRGRHVLVVGGGDSALEAAASIAEQPGSTVTLSYRSEAFTRAKEKNRARVREAAATGRLRILMKSEVKLIEPRRVVLEHEGRRVAVVNDAVIISIGGVLPTPFLEKLGIEVETKYGTA